MAKDKQLSFAFHSSRASLKTTSSCRFINGSPPLKSGHCFNLKWQIKLLKSLLVSIPSNRVIVSMELELLGTDIVLSLNPLKSGHCFNTCEGRGLYWVSVRSQSPQIGSLFQ